MLFNLVFIIRKIQVNDFQASEDFSLIQWEYKLHANLDIMWSLCLWVFVVKYI